MSQFAVSTHYFLAGRKIKERPALLGDLGEVQKAPGRA
jgi:hypothetical protein